MSLRLRFFRVLALWGTATVAGSGGWAEESAPPDESDASATASDWVATFQCEPLTDLYYHPDDFPEGLQRLISMGKDSFEAIEAGLEDKDPLIRFTCMVALNKMTLDDDARSSVARWMTGALRDTSSWVRTEAAWGLGVLRWEEGEEPLLSVLDDDDPGAVKEALVALDKLHWRVLPQLMTSAVLSDNRADELVKEWKLYMHARADGEDVPAPRILPEGSVVREVPVDAGTEAVASYVIEVPEPPPLVVLKLGSGGKGSEGEPQELLDGPDVPDETEKEFEGP